MDRRQWGLGVVASLGLWATGCKRGKKKRGSSSLGSITVINRAGVVTTVDGEDVTQGIPITFRITNTAFGVDYLRDIDAGATVVIDIPKGNSTAKTGDQIPLDYQVWALVDAAAGLNEPNPTTSGTVSVTVGSSLTSTVTSSGDPLVLTVTFI